VYMMTCACLEMQSLPRARDVFCASLLFLNSPPSADLLNSDISDGISQKLFKDYSTSTFPGKASTAHCGVYCQRLLVLSIVRLVNEYLLYF
jgi:hypothetical protein